MARRASKEWPERKYCDSENSFFTCSLWDGFGERSLGRMIRNDAEVSAALKSLEQMDWSEFKLKVRFQDVDYNVLTFQEQIEIDLQTDIMIGKWFICCLMCFMCYLCDCFRSSWCGSHAQYIHARQSRAD
jgi:hypothetical protein